MKIPERRCRVRRHSILTLIGAIVVVLAILRALHLY